MQNDGAVRESSDAGGPAPDGGPTMASQTTLEAITALPTAQDTLRSEWPRELAAWLLPTLAVGVGFYLALAVAGRLLTVLWTFEIVH